MVIEYNCTKDDYKGYIRQFYISRLPKTLFVLIIVPLLIGDYFAGKPFNWTKFFYALFFSEIIITIAYFIIPYFASLRKINNLISTNQNYLKTRRLIPEDDGIRVEYPEEIQVQKWESLASVECTNDYIIIYLVDKNALVIPKRAFVSQVEATNFLGIIQNKINLAKGKISGTVKTSKFSAPYWLGLLCLIPFIGAVIGLVIAILGIRYKDKWFTLIGVAGIIITIVFYFFLIGTLEDLAASGDSSKNFSQSEPNKLVEDIEYYKVLNGQYPDSLQQLVKIIDWVMINDPVQPLHGRSKALFNYERISDKYKLFSSGHDGIPGTRDDIYPKLPGADISKTGWIKDTLPR
jgi:hypothetical protein